MSWELIKKTAKRNWVLLLIFFGVLTMYFSVMVSMYDPEDTQELVRMLELFPDSVINMLGFSSTVTNLTSYLASWLYGMLMLAFPLVYSVILGNRLVAKMVDNGSFAYLLSTPNSRLRLVVTQGLYGLASIAVLFAAIFGLGTLICVLAFPGQLDIGAFLRLNVTTMLVNMAVMSICFFFSCLFNESKLATGFGAALPIAFLLMHMLGGASPDAEILKKISIYGFYDPVRIVTGTSALSANLAYVGIVAVLFAAGVVYFQRKRLPL